MACQVHVDSAPDGSSSASRLPSPLMSGLIPSPAAGTQLQAQLSNQELLNEVVLRCQHFDPHAWLLQGDVAPAALVEGAASRDG